MRRLKIFQNCLNNAVKIIINIVVPETKNTISSAFNPSIASFIKSAIEGMPFAVKFDDKLSFKTDKINNIPAQRMLTAKPPSSQPLASQCGPQSAFGVGLVSSQISGAFISHSPHFIAQVTVLHLPLEGRSKFVFLDKFRVGVRPTPSQPT